MNDSPVATRPTQPTNSGTSQSGGFARGFRKALLLLLVVACCYLAYGFGRLWAEWRAATQPAPIHNSQADSLAPISAVLPLAGQWSFGDLDWDLRSEVIDRDQVEASFAKLIEPADEARFQTLPDVGPELLEAAATLQLRPQERGGYQLYCLDRSDLKAQFVARNVGGRAKAVVAAVAFPQNDQQWQWYELIPRSATPTSEHQADHLLPLPADAVRSGARFADDGRLLLELVTVNSNADSLLGAWKNAGWEVRPSGLSSVPGFSFLCGRGNDIMYAWSADPEDAIHNLMLVRSPTNDELKAEQLSTDGSNSKDIRAEAPTPQ